MTVDVDAQGRGLDPVGFGSDAIVRMLADLGIEYAALNPGASFRGIHDSLVNMRGAPALIQCLHEEISVALAHGYAKAAGRPMVACLHNVVGLQHASMAIFNAWCDRVPVLLVGGGGPRDAARRRPWIEWIHSALLQGELVREYVKWDDEPQSLASVPESLARAYRVACTQPTGPVYVNFDVFLQEDALPSGYATPNLDRYTGASAPVAPSGQLKVLAHMLAEAQNPVIVVDRVTDPGATATLAEVLGAPVLDRGNRVGIPNHHPLDLTGMEQEVLAQADLVLGLEVDDLFGALHSWSRERQEATALASNSTVAHVSLRELSLHSWSADYQRLPQVDYPVLGDADDASRQLARLLSEYPAARREARRESLARQHDVLRSSWLAQATRSRADGDVIRPEALAAEMWDCISERPFCLANDATHGWARRLWRFDRPRCYLGKSGGGGMGYGIGASAGAALALRGSETMAIDVQGDGDLLYTPEALWTIAKYQLPLLIVMDNNRAYMNSEHHGREVARMRGRSVENAAVGNEIAGPHVDFAALARSLGVTAEGPVTRVQDLKGALERAIAIVQEGRPVLVDVITCA